MTSSTQTHEPLVSEQPRRCLTIAATFTAEPVLEPLDFWTEELSLFASVEFAPYNQVFQQLLDPDSPLSRNRDGVNMVLIRLEDWMRSRPESAGIDDLDDFLGRNAADLIDAARQAAARSTVPLIVGVCPDSPAVRRLTRRDRASRPESSN